MPQVAQKNCEIPHAEWRSSWRALSSNRGLWALLFLLLTLVAYKPALNGPFFFDDEHFIVRNDMVHDLGRMSQIYKSNTTAGAFIAGNFYRPNQQAVYAILYSMFGVTTSVPYHLTSILLHAVSGILLQAWLMMLGFGIIAAASGSLVFLLHPVQSESVAYISGMSDPIAMVFLLGGLICYTRGVLRRKTVDKRWLICAVLSFVMALLSRENAIVFAPIVCVLTLFLRRTEPRPDWRQQLKVLFIFCSLAAIYIALKFTLLNFQGEFGLTDKINPYTQSFAVRITTFVSVLWDYIVLIFYPVDLFYEKPYRAFLSLWQWRGLFGLSIVMALAIIIYFAKRWPRVAFGFAMVACGLIPFCGAVPLNAMYLEHWLYIPMLGLATLTATLWQNHGRGQYRRPLVVCFACLFSLMLVRTHARAGEWGSVEQFYLNEIANGGVSIRILNNLAMHYAEQNETEKAEEYYKKAIEESGDNGMPQPHHNLARIYAEKGRIQEAVLELRKAIAIDHGFIYSLDFLEKIFQAAGDERRAAALRAAVQAVYEGKSYDYASLESLVFGS